jgi:hypothetical protein
LNVTYVLYPFCRLVGDLRLKVWLREVRFRKEVVDSNILCGSEKSPDARARTSLGIGEQPIREGILGLAGKAI